MRYLHVFANVFVSHIFLNHLSNCHEPRCEYEYYLTEFHRSAIVPKFNIAATLLGKYLFY
jgi:hypothetical protein